MKKINILVSALALGALFVSCEDTRLNGIPENKVYMGRSGLQTVEIYDLNRPEVRNLSVVKAGYHDVAATVTLDTVGQFEIDQYNREFSMNIINMPDSCYSFTKSTLNIGPKDQYISTSYTVNIPALKRLQDANPNKVYGMPIKLLGSSLEVNEKQDLSIFTVKLLPARVSMSKYGEQDLALDAKKDTTYFSFNLSVPFDNPFGLICKIENSQEAFEAFNLSKGGVYTRLPEEALIDLKSEYLIPKGQKSVTVTYGISKKKAGIGLFAFVPVLTEITPEDPTVDILVRPDEVKSVYQGVVTTMKNFDRSKWKLSSPHTEPSEGALANLIDGNFGTFWHSQWSVGPGLPSPAKPETWAYFLVELEKLSTVGLMKIAPRVGANTYTEDGFVEFSTDGVTYEKVIDHFGFKANGFINLAVSPTKDAKFIKVWSTKNYGQISEFEVLGADIQ